MSATLDDVIDAALDPRGERHTPPCTRALVADTVAFSSVDGPGNRFVVFLQGCNFDCVACHNPQTIPGQAAAVDGHHPHHVSVDELLVQIRRAAPFISGITVSGGEATQQAPFVRALCAAIKANPALHHLTCLVDSNGACATSVWDDLEHVVDGVMVDLKCFDADIHRELTGQPNDRVLATIRHLAGIGRLHEVRLLLVAGLNDDPGLIRATGQWLARVDPSMRVKLIGFRAHGARPHDPPLREPTPESLAEAATIVRSVADFHVTVV
jgi:pyruvate formate lyase activating enzyme